jgi:drug/metabolite transporter (DMT)-like permease
VRFESAERLRLIAFFATAPGAVTLAVLSTAVFATMHALVRFVSGELHPFEIAFFRSLFGLLTLLPLVFRHGPGAWVSAQPRLQLLRGVISGTSLMCWFYGLSVVPLAEATALSFTNAIFASLGAVIFLRERMGVRRWSAVVVGLVGALVILRPGEAAVSAGALIVLLSAACWGGGTVIIKRLSRTDSAITIALWMATMMIVVSVIPACLVWVRPTPGQLLWLALIGGLASVGTLAYTQALKLADATLIIPIDFTRLVWASAIGFVAFGEIPDSWTWGGGFLIIGSTIYIALREVRLGRRQSREKALENPVRGDSMPAGENKEERCQ